MGYLNSGPLDTWATPRSFGQSFQFAPGLAAMLSLLLGYLGLRGRGLFHLLTARPIPPGLGGGLVEEAAGQLEGCSGRGLLLG